MIGVLSVLLLLAATGCGHVPFGSARKAGASRYSGTVVQTTAHDKVTLPDGYDPITTLAGDPKGSGVWFWANTKTTLSIFPGARRQSSGRILQTPRHAGPVPRAGDRRQSRRPPDRHRDRSREQRRAV